MCGDEFEAVARFHRQSVARITSDDPVYPLVDSLRSSVGSFLSSRSFLSPGDISSFNFSDQVVDSEGNTVHFSLVVDLSCWK